MPSVNPIAGIPGVAPDPDKFPQWGVTQLASGGSKDYAVKEAKSESEKLADLKAGYDIWFSSLGAAQAYVSSENSALNGNLPVKAGWHLIFGNDNGLLVRILKVGFGGLLMIIGVLQLSGIKTSQVATAALL